MPNRPVFFRSAAAVWMAALVILTATYVLSQAQIANPNILKLFKPLPAAMDSADNSPSDAKIKLGRMLYFEPRLSKDQKVSCNTCHPLDTYGAEPKPVSTGHKGQKGTRNAPTVYNAAGHFVQFWDGRAPDVEEQAKGPVMNPVEMAMPTEAEAVLVLKSMPEYMALFQKAFPKQKEPVSFNNMALAIAAFERRLVTPGRWDKFLQGEKTALTSAEIEGFNTFAKSGCYACHNGAYLGGAAFQKLGVVEPWPNEKDPGRYQVTKQPADKMMFKVPSLRNITKTAPYFHDGSVATLEEAVQDMAVYQRGTRLSEEDVKLIITWLGTLQGEVPADYIKMPDLPKSTEQTPKASGE